jgi:hypothetical protein
MARVFNVNWHIFGAIQIEADGKDTAEKVVRRMDLATLSEFGCPDYELEVSEGCGCDSAYGSEDADERVQEVPATGSMADLFGE